MNWKDALHAEVSENKDDWDLLVHTMTKNEFEREFDGGYGGAEGCPFTAWTDNFVYFPVQYDGAEWVGSVPRHPNNTLGPATNHVGGG